VKRVILILLIVLALAGVAATLWGNRLVAATLDAQLAPLLTRQLGLPVTLAPIEAKALSLRATSAKLVMGDPEDPAVVATDVRVRLSWPKLLTGTVSFVYAAADDLMVKTARWPKSGNPLPDNYRFLDPWLPRTLELNSGRYVTEKGTAYPVQAAQWQQQLVGSGVQINWQEQRKGGLVELAAELTSLDDLLDLNDFQLTLNGEIDGVEDSDFTLAVDIQPDDKHAYVLSGTLEAIDTTVTTQATGSQRWTWPDASRSHYSQLDLGTVRTFLNLYGNPDEEDSAEAFLASAPPALNLIPHKGTLTIDETLVGDESIRNATLEFVADGQGLHIDRLHMVGPKSELKGAVDIISSPEGWNFSLDANLRASEGASIGQGFVDNEWIWEEGNAQLKGHGTTWGDLLYSLEGQVTAAGHHRGEVDTPVKMEAVLDSNPGRLKFDHLEIALGDGRFHGSAILSGTEHRKLTLDLTGDKLHVDFLFDDDEELGGPGIAVPEYLEVLPSLDMDWTLNVIDLDAPGLSLASAHARLERFEEWGKLVFKADGVTGGTLNLGLDADYPGDDPGHYELHASLDSVDLPAMFQQQSILHSRSSGTLHFEGTGREMLELFKDMKGTTSLAVEVRSDNNWQRPPRDNEKLDLKGAGSFVIDGRDIIGIALENLDIESTEQDITGTLSMVASRSPWLIADLHSDRLDVYGLMELFPQSTKEAERVDFLQSMRNLGAGQISLKVDSLTVGDAPVSRMTLQLESEQDLFKINELAFSAQGSRLEGSGEIVWQHSLAKLELATTLTDVDFDQFIIRDPTLEPVRVDGTAQLSSEGKTVAELIANFTGHIELASKEMHQASGEPSRHLLMKTRRLENGVEANVEKLRLSENHLTGTLRYTRDTPPLLDIEIHGGYFSLLPWETRHVTNGKDGKKKSKDGESGIRKAASASAGAVGRVLRAPLRMLQASEDRSKERMFSDNPLPLDSLKTINLKLKGELDTLESSVASLHQLAIDGTLIDGVLDITASTGDLNEGQAKVDLSIDAKTLPPSMKVVADFNDVRGLTSDNTYTRSGFASVTAQGNSTAALTASLNGLLYLDLGPGPFDYRNATLLSSGIATQVFNTLIPGSTQKTPQLECGITVMEFTNGQGKTPYGYAIRTNRANLLGNFNVDLAKETMELNFESRSREGVGLSVGNVISNSVQVRGSIADPYIVPRATSLAWRGWAAFMTAGLSVVAESVLKRAMASENPCPHIRKLIRDEMCPKSPIAASSKRMCPEGQTAAAN
jgi:hypothetical protein